MSKAANRHAQTMVSFFRREMRMLEEMDRRKRSGTSNEDDDHANAHLTHVAEDGAKTWTY